MQLFEIGKRLLIKMKTTL